MRSLVGCNSDVSPNEIKKKQTATAVRQVAETQKCTSGKFKIRGEATQWLHRGSSQPCERESKRIG